MSSSKGSFTIPTFLPGRVVAAPPTTNAKEGEDAPLWIPDSGRDMVLLDAKWRQSTMELHLNQVLIQVVNVGRLSGCHGGGNRETEAAEQKAAPCTTGATSVYDAVVYPHGTCLPPA